MKPPKRPQRPQADRRDPDDPHLPHTTRYHQRDDLQIPPAAQAVIDEQWPEVIRTFQQYDKGAGMLMLYGTVRDACKAAGWDDSMAYLMRDFLIGKLNKEKVKTYTGSDYERGDWETFNMKESRPVVRAMKIAEGGHKAGCKCGFCQNMNKLRKGKSDGGDKTDDKEEKTPTAESLIHEKNWIKGAVNPKHKGYCTPMSKETCTPRRKALAMRFKKGDIHKDNEANNESVRAAKIVSNLLDS